MPETYDLNLVQGESYRRGFRHLINDVPEPLANYTWRAQARKREKPDADLLIDLNQYIELNVDGITLDLYLPSSVTFAIDRVGSKSAWDLFIWPTTDPEDKNLIIQGTLTLDPAATDLSA